jgi:hypothetical protein
MKNIQVWEAKFNKYNEIEKTCLTNIANVFEIKNNLTKLLGNQKKDDIVFYKSIIDNSHFYLTSSMKIRKTKFIKDLNSIWFQINDCKQMDELNKSNFASLLKDYEKMSKDIIFAKENNTILTWVKDDKIESLQVLENEFNEIMDYHITTIDHFCKMSDLERLFYCGK